MARLLRMPETMANSVEAIIQRWYLPEGVEFPAGATILAVETEKAVVDIEEEKPGIILRKIKAENIHVEVGAPIALIGDPGEKVEDIDALLIALGVDQTLGANNIAAENSNIETNTRGKSLLTVSTGESTENKEGRIFASPLARLKAKELGISIEEVSGTGPNARVRRVDVESKAGFSNDAKPISAEKQGFEVIPHSNTRKMIARRLVQSKQEVPHFYISAAVNVGNLMALRADMNSAGLGRISVNDLIVKLAASTHNLVPDFNVTWHENEIHRYSQVDISIAIAGKRGLVTPVIRDVNNKSTREIAGEVNSFKEKISTNQLKQSEIEGGSFSISNLGMYGIDSFIAIINPPQAAILAVGAAKKEAVVIDNRIEIADVIHFNLSVDHRCVDGALAAHWMKTFVGLIESPPKDSL